MRFVVTVRLLWPSDEAVAHSEGGKSSRTSGWSICANRVGMFILNDLRNFQHKGIGVIY